MWAEQPEGGVVWGCWRRWRCAERGLGLLAEEQLALWCSKKCVWSLSLLPGIELLKPERTRGLGHLKGHLFTCWRGLFWESSRLSRSFGFPDSMVAGFQRGLSPESQADTVSSFVT